eukprot:6724672-Prymnesium_polylepis.1
MQASARCAAETGAGAHSHMPARPTGSTGITSTVPPADVLGPVHTALSLRRSLSALNHPLAALAARPLPDAELAALDA